MKHYWMHFKEDTDRGFREGWYVKLSWSSLPSCGWLYQLDNKDWLFYIQDSDKKMDIEFKGFTKREVMKRCVAILKLLNEIESEQR